LIQRSRNFSLAIESPSLRWIDTIVENLAILLINATSLRKINSRARKMMRRKKRSSSRRKKASTIGFTKRRMGKYILLVIGSPMSHPVLEGKPNANHVRARISNSRTPQLHK
jgi:hypothetical protein